MSARYFVLFTLAAAVVWCGFAWTYHQLFAWSEWVPGINLVYFPHGLRMILVILFAEAGAVGIVLGSMVGGMDLMRTNPALGLAHSLVAGAAVWLAARFVIKPSPKSSLLPQTAGGIAAINGRSLILLAFVSSALNSLGHVLGWLLFDTEAKQLAVRFATMFTGDLLGAVILLYALRALILFIERKQTPRS
jgi:hypothetical protein